MKFNVYCDSYYPYYGLSDWHSTDNDPAIELTLEEHKDYLSVKAAWQTWQKRLSNAEK